MRKFCILASLLLSINWVNAQNKDSINLALNLGQVSINSPDSAKYSINRPDGIAPAGIMNDHVHKKGEWMISYSYMNTYMAGNQQSTSKISEDQVFQNYFGSPTAMTMQMHMLMGMYGITDRLTAMATVAYQYTYMAMDMNPTMQMHMADGGPMPMANMTTNTSGIGDTKLYAFYKASESKLGAIVIGCGLSIPTGSIEQKSQTINGDTAKTAYCMQNGSGSFGILPSVTYKGQVRNCSWGISEYATIYTGANADGYQLGNQYTLTGYTGYKFGKYISLSVRASITNTGSIKGYDPAIAVYAQNDPTANTANAGGTIANIYGGANIYLPSGLFRGLRLTIEYGAPFYQNLNGTQMTTVNSLTASLAYQFGGCHCNSICHK